MIPKPIPKPKKKKALGYYKEKAWDMFSKYIRTRDCLATTGTIDEGVCVTCGQRFSFKELQAGHAIGQRNNSILFDEELVNAQCGGCNFYRNGEYAKYSVWFIKRYGLKRWEEKVELSKELRKYSKNDLIEIREEYKEKLETLMSNI